MPCACDLTKTGYKKVVLRNPKTGKIVTEIKVPVQVSQRKGPQLLPGLRNIKHETMMRYVYAPRRPTI